MSRFRKSCAYGETGQLLNLSPRVIPSISVLPSNKRTMLETHVFGSYVKEAIKHINGGTPSFSIQQGMTLIGDKRTPNRTSRSMDAKAGSPTSGDAHGDGTLIVAGSETKMKPNQ